VAGGVGVEAQQGLFDPHGVGVQDGVPDVVAQGAEVGGVVVEAFEFEQDRRIRRAVAGTSIPSASSTACR